MMIDRARTLPLLVLIAFRPEFQPAWGRSEHVATMALSRLSAVLSAHFIARVAGGKPLPAELVAQMVDKTDGVPLFLEELTKAVLESGMVIDAGERYEYANTVDRMTVPATLRDSLMARLDRLIPVKEIAKIGAVIGREFSYALVAAISPMREPQLLHALDRLTCSELVQCRGTPPNAVYVFKHALVQDAAYDSLLKVKRQELHGRIAEVILEQTPGKRDTEPELLAHHCTAAGQIALAIPLWLKAGELALGRLALTESIAHLERGLELVSLLPCVEAREAAELSLGSLLGTAWMALRGWPAQQVADHLEPALQLARRLNASESMVAISFGLWANVLVRGRIADSLVIAHEALEQSRANGNDDLLIVGHVEAMISEFWLGNLLNADEHGRRILALYDAEAHRHIVKQTNFDPKTAYGLYASHWFWMLGYPDKAARISDEKDAHALCIGHVFDAGFALTTGVQVFEYRREPHEALKRIEIAERIGRESSVPFVSEVLAQMMRGMAYASAGRGGEAVAEILRCKAWMLQRSNDLEGAETCLRDSIAFACRQQARTWELRSATLLATLLDARGDRQEALQLLKPVYSWFTEGFDTKDVMDAKALLDRMEGVGPEPTVTTVPAERGG